MLRVALLAGAFVVSLALAACSGGEGPGAGEPPAAESSQEATATAERQSTVTPTAEATTLPPDMPEPAVEEGIAPTSSSEPTWESYCPRVWGHEPLCDIAVAGVGDGCLELRRWPGSGAPVVGCLPEGARLIGAGRYGNIATEEDGVIWRLVGIPRATQDKIESLTGSRPDFQGGDYLWADAGHLDGPHTRLVEMPLPAVDFPNDVVLLARAAFPTGVGSSNDLARIYREDGDGDLLMETLFAATTAHSAQQCEDDFDEDFFSVDYAGIQTIAGQLPECGGYHLNLAANPDGSSIVMTVCVKGPCAWIDGAVPEDPGRTAIYESKDGGVTWERLTGFDLPWRAIHVLPDKDENGRTQLIIQIPFVNQDDEGFDPMLWPSGKKIVSPPAPPGYSYLISFRRSILLDNGRLAWGLEDVRGDSDGRGWDLYLTEDGEDVTALVSELLGGARLEGYQACPASCLWLPDGRVLMRAEYPVHELVGHRGAATGWSRVRQTWPTIRDLETGEQWPLRLPRDMLTLGYGIGALAIQQGPFLRVVDVGESCLPIRTGPSPDAEELACAAERVLLTDLKETMELEDTIWHRVRAPAGIEGWADGQFLE